MLSTDAAPCITRRYISRRNDELPPQHAAKVTHRGLDFKSRRAMFADTFCAPHCEPFSFCVMGAWRECFAVPRVGEREGVPSHPSTQLAANDLG
jgi:hypothetical protein